ncbi:hypothetical protein Hypma_012150 [Hypsizygus marmoreus]|uniref:Uncharacterized protein n=1 Tax=Hypsizygus marmoreus TaxID=39966 RepID=A0A369JP66_HYPMA|nr:hypothetical protein Hypma_012150 [Hypsizygus marmoreus]
MSDLITKFNALPRHPQVPNTQVPNAWVFTIRHVPIPPAADLVMVVNPHTHEAHCEGPFDLTSYGTVNDEEYCAVVAHALVRLFAEGMGRGNETATSQVSGAPWSWGTTDETLARGVERVLKAIGIREELLEVGVIPAEGEVRSVVDGLWEDLFGTIKRSVE